MSKKVKLQAPDLSTATQQEVAAPQPNVAVQLFTIGKLPRNGLNEGTKHGEGGTAGTYKAVCAALAGKDGLSMEAIKTVCKDNKDPGFARYAVRNHWLLPVETK